MIRATFIIIASATALLFVSEPMDSPVAMADIVRDEFCVLSRHDDAMPREAFTCDLSQYSGNIYSTA